MATKYMTLATCQRCRYSSVVDADESESQRQANIAAMFADGWTTDPVVCPKCNESIRREDTPPCGTRLP